MLVSLSQNFYEEFAEDIPFLNFAIILLKDLKTSNLFNLLSI